MEIKIKKNLCGKESTMNVIGDIEMSQLIGCSSEKSSEA